MRLILTRHGETVENVGGVLQGQLPGTLTEKGFEQAKALALRLKSEKIDCIYSSDLKRSVETAKEVKLFHPGAKLVLVKGLREFDFGPFTGAKLENMDWDKRPKEVESRESMRARVRLVLEQAFLEYPTGCVLFVGHAGTNKAVVSVLKNESAGYMRVIKPQDNVAIAVFEIVSCKGNVFELG